MASRIVLWLLLAVVPFTAGQLPPAAVFVTGYSKSLLGSEAKYPPRGQAVPSPAPYFISKLNFDSIPGKIVVGAADCLYVFNQNLSMDKLPLCLPPNTSTAICSAAVGYNPDYVCRNHLRVFLSNPIDSTRLVVCGSEAIGTPSCRAVNISNLASFNAVAAANGTVSIRPDFYGSGIAYNVNNPRGINFFAVSTLNLDASNTGLFFLTVTYTNPSDPNTLYTELKLRTNSIANFRTPVFVDTYVANYAPRTALLPGVMDTISPDEHKYFYVFVRDIDSTNRPISQLVRVCQNDPGYGADNAPLTLVKARINCISPQYSTNYSAISGVTFNEMGRYYQNGDWSQFMYGVFTTSVGGAPVSAVCVYPANNSVEDSTGQFGRNEGVFDIFRTLLVNPNTGAMTTSGYVECTANGNMARPDYTFTDTVLPIKQIGTEPLAVISGVTVTKIVLDQTCVFTNDITAHKCVIQDVLFLGTAVGTVLKVALAMGTGNTAVPIVSEEIKLDDLSSVRQMEIQQQGGMKYLYVNTDTSIYRLPVQRCDRYDSFRACVCSRDPYCAWNNTSCVMIPIVPTDNSGSINMSSSLYQNIHTGDFNCSLKSSVSTSVPATSTPSASTTVAQIAASMTPAMTPATMTSVTMTPATMTPATNTSATMTPATMTPATCSTSKDEPITLSQKFMEILSNSPSIGIIGGLGGICALQFLLILLLCCCLVRHRLRTLPNPSDPTFPEKSVIANSNAGTMDLYTNPLIQHVDRDSVYFRSTSEPDGTECQIQLRGAMMQENENLSAVKKPGTRVAAKSIPETEGDTSLTAI